MSYRAVPQARQRRPLWFPRAYHSVQRNQQQQQQPLLLFKQQSAAAVAVDSQFVYLNNLIPLTVYGNVKETITSLQTTKTPVIWYKLVHFNNYYNYCQYRTVNNTTFNKPAVPALYIHIPITTTAALSLPIATAAATKTNMGYRYRYLTWGFTFFQLYFHQN